MNGIVLAEDGKKMSKRLNNYPDPQSVLDSHGADATRLYLLTSPVVRAENLAFSEASVAQMGAKVMGRLVNVYSFYELYKDSVVHEPSDSSTNILDQWIIARMYEVHGEVTKAMDAYELDRATRPLLDLVDDLSTWYIRRSRDRLKNADEEDKRAALATIAWVLRKYAKLCAPFTPFIAEWLWQRVKTAGNAESVHLVAWCTVKEANQGLLVTMQKTRDIVSSALEKRAQVNIKVRQPLSKLTIQASLGAQYLELIQDEVNVKEVVVDTALSELVQLDTDVSEELKMEGDAREIIREIQGARKKEDFDLADKGDVVLSGPRATIVAANAFKKEIEAQTGTTLIILEDAQEELTVIVTKK